MDVALPRLSNIVECFDKEMKSFASSSRDDFDFVLIAVTCYCFATEKKN